MCIRDRANVVAEQKPADVEALMGCKMGEGTVDEALKALILVIKENIKVRRFASYEGHCAAYVHGGGTHGAVSYTHLYVIDTSLLSTAQNRERVSSLFLQKGQCAMSINVVSFGFKYGLPQEADIVFDVRCLPNPFYVPELKAVSYTHLDVYKRQSIITPTGRLMQPAALLYSKWPQWGRCSLSITAPCSRNPASGRKAAATLCWSVKTQALTVSYTHLDVYKRQAFRCCATARKM